MNIVYSLLIYSFIGIFLLLTSLNNLTIFVIFILGLMTYFIAQKFIPKIAQYMLKKDIFGKDINKKGSPMGEMKIPQCVGFASAIAFIIVSLIVSLIINIYQKYYPQKGQNYSQIHLAYLVTILGTILLGFADDMLELPWRYKLIFPFFIVIPLIINYSGPTQVIFLYPINLILQSIDFGILFLLYIVLLGIYCTNTINIYAGINGLQVGQSIVAAASLLIIFGIKAFKQQSLTENYYYSIYLLVTFLGSSIALIKQNAYPSKVFIGDTYCYFAGIILCIASIIGQNGISIHWLLLPQLINFLYSCPQLFGIYPCPRHRLTNYIINENKLQAKQQNMNLLNLSLRILGRTHEGQLCKKLLYFQIMTSLIPIIYQILQ